MLENIYFWFKLNKNQSLMYQIMIVLMEEHKKARLGKNYIGIYDGGDSLVFDKPTWKKMKKKILRYISDSYKDLFSEMQEDYIIGLFPGRVDALCYLRKLSLAINIGNDVKNNVENKPEEVTFDRGIDHDEKYMIEFSMTNAGYSYQYNGYKKTQEKLQITANRFVLMTLIYYILSWVFPESKVLFSKINDVYSFIKNATFKSTSILLRIVFILAIWEIIKYFFKKATKK